VFYALAGERAKALNILDELKVLSQRRYVSPFDIAVVHLGLGDLISVFQYPLELRLAVHKRVSVR
jgi:hypothetical protein